LGASTYGGRNNDRQQNRRRAHKAQQWARTNKQTRKKLYRQGAGRSYRRGAGRSACVLYRGNGRQQEAPGDPFILLLTGIYQSVPEGKGPADNLGLDPKTINLNDGSYSKTKIYPVFGIHGAKNQKRRIGTFYASLTTGLCAYDLPGGAIAMQFLPPPAGAPPGFNSLVAFLDGSGGQYDEGTWELTILEATGVYSAFKGGHNHMVDKLHQLVAGPVFAGFHSSGYDEFCFCNISQYPFP
jgi:hypothetical protein